MLSSSFLVALDMLRANVLRTLLSTLGVIMGVAALVAVLSVGDGMERFARDQVERTTDLQSIVARPITTRRVDGLSVPREDYPRFTTATLAEVGARLAGVGTVSLSGGGGAFVAAPDAAAGAPPRVALLDARAGMVVDSAWAASLLAGRPLTDAESRDTVRLAVVSARLAQEILGAAPAAAVGRAMLIGGAAFTIVGVQPDVGDDDLMGAMVPFATAEGRYVRENASPASLVVSAGRIEDVTVAQSRLEAWLAEGNAHWRSDVRVLVNQGRLEQITQGVKLFKLFMGAVTGIALLVGGVGIMNVMLASVIERTREIGVRKAMGATNRAILTQFLAESVAITGAGSGIGAVVGISGAFAVTAIMRARTEAEIHAAVSISTVIVIVTIAAVLGLTFGIYPALRAARLSPIDAIRHES